MLFACAMLYMAFPALRYFSTLSRKRHDFRKAVEHKICVLNFSKTFVWNIFHSKNNRARYDQKCMLVFMYSTDHSCQVLLKLEFSRQIFEKYSNIRFHENPSSVSCVVPCGQTDRWTDTTQTIVVFRNFANAPKILHSSYRLFICFECFSKQTANLFLYNTQWLVL